MSFCHCPHDVVNKASENHMATQCRYATNSLTAQDVEYKVQKKRKQTHLQLSPRLRRVFRAHNSENVNLDCQVAGKLTFKWNFIDSRVWTNQRWQWSFLLRSFIPYNTKRVEQQMAATILNLVYFRSQLEMPDGMLDL